MFCKLCQFDKYLRFDKIKVFNQIKPHTSLATQQKLSEFGWEVLMHLPYSPNLAPSDFHLFRSLQNSLGKNTVRFWFQRFRSGNFDLQNKPRGWPETKVDNAELKAIVKADPSQTTSEIAAGCGVSDKTVLIHLKQIGKVKKLERWVPHELSAANRQTRFDYCVILLNRHNNEGILNRIITCDEKWIMYDNRKRSSQWLNPGEAAKSCPKRELTKKKLLVSV
ncbi:hypothetical protein K1T71_001882 [Dendrolimus kikuchii]|uniref:Uncharacterized protein n=1 Tax=Dendrolimus kikuchii TaxID=765133 RepID=A0ACC1DEX7_9NEOP|nr:hypothetical protein K1T71_001882 [Dendrolimus kikuchii]